jgi:putative peptidoglycan lipid II flippase
MVATALRGFALGLFAWSGQALVSRAFFALRDSLTPVLIGTAITGLFIPLCFVLMRWLDYAGLALATSLAAMGQLVWMLWALRRRLPASEQPDMEPLVRPVLLTGVASLAMGGVAWLIYPWLLGWTTSWQPNLAAFVRLVVVAGVSGLFYLWFASWLRLPEVAAIRAVWRRRLGGGSQPLV